jgi:ribosomal protein L11 methyltransferase
VDAVDNDPIAVSVTRQNARINGVGERVRAAVADGIPRAAKRRSERGYDVVLANILAGPLIKLAPSVSRATRVGGIAILSGILVPEAAAVLAAYRAQGFALIAHRRLEGWSTLTLLKRRSNAPGPSRRARHAA